MFRRDQDRGQKPFDSANNLHRFKSGHFWQMHVHQGEMNVLMLDDIDRLLTAFGEEGVKPLGLKDLAQRFPGERVVVGDQQRKRAVERHHKPIS